MEFDLTIGYGAVAPENTAVGSPEGGWEHSGLGPDEAGYDRAMIQATADDLVFFTSLDDLRSRGFRCVAILSMNSADAPVNRSAFAHGDSSGLPGKLPP